ncbi:transporter substrate-binding domain-containing protein [Aequitasia blattaphilus]|uniref:Transporter substrate-binding domain-containing protein n=1 Tax=Aequitasia blattaphilus TaxID=2949332 RepID=A0ABT1E8A5_9FIRM|nr:transporter substrate-binding domain-containing protein [Aequitasia blattaphilus]MCP1102018.1 transporter substrate-binding domain-containing protein [Aequitasia blattaphilus]MCR8614658.1 transporter substrate-binding domain-containing protein [Aequitasia blattaphilus]
MKSLFAVLLAIALVGSLAACGNKEEESSKEDGAAGGATTYKIATDTTFAPFEFEDEEGNFVGIDMDLLNKIAEDQGFEVDLQVLGFNAAVQAVESGQADGVIAGMSITDERKEKFDFSEAYFDSGVVMGVAKDSDIKSYDDLKGKKVAIKTGTEGSTFAESIKDEYGFETVVFDDSNAMYQEVATGNSVACFEDYPVLGYGISQGLELKIVTEKEQGSSYGFAVKKGENAELLKMFNEGLKNLKESGEYDEILDTYIAE